jgi:hypothetical protein
MDQTFKIAKKSGVSTTYELHVKAIASEAAAYGAWCSSSHLAKYIMERLETIPRMSTAYAHLSYQVNHTQDAVEVWHLNSLGDKDRLTIRLEKIINVKTD